MSDDEDQVVGSDEELSEEETSSESEEESEDEKVVEKKSTEAQIAMQKRRAKQSSLGANLDENAQEVLETSRVEREKLEDEIAEMRARNEKRKSEREEEERKLTARRIEEDKQRKALEEEKIMKKGEDEVKRREMRAARLAAYEALSLPAGRNFIITKKDGEEVEVEDNEGQEERERKEKKSKEQQEQERRAILQQRVKPINMGELNSADKLKDKAKELHAQIVRLESEKYDLEKRFKAQQYDMMELAERARQMNKVGKGGLKRVQLKEDDRADKIQEKYAGAPAKVEMYSVFERQRDLRSYGDRHVVFHGATRLFPAKRITPCKIVKWDEDTGLPIYEEIEGAVPPEEQEAEEE